MTNAWKQQEGQIVDGRYRLVLYLGGSDHSAVFLTELPNTRERAAIKLIGSDPAETDSQLSRLRRAAKLSHPHLARILEIGQAQIGSAHVVYLVTDYAEEDLSLILPDRALSPEEVREMLPLIVDTLQYLHSHGFAHARMKPSNIQAVNDQLKLSIDGVCAPHERGSSGEKPTPYDPPEFAPTGPSPAGDIWSLGMTIVEVLTQRLPIWEWTGHADPPAPRTLPAPFLEIVRNCLRRDPAMRCTLREISENLEPQPVQQAESARIAAINAAPTLKTTSYGAASSQPERAPAINPLPQKSNSRFIVQAAAFVLALAAVIAIPRYFRHSAKSTESEPISASAAAPDAAKTDAPKIEVASQPVTQPVAQPAPQPAAQPAPPPPAPKPEPAPKPAAHVSAPRAKAPDPKPFAAKKPAPPVAAPPTPRPAVTAPAVASPSPHPVVKPPASAPARGQVAHKAMPDVSQKALETIRGKVRVSVKVNVDASGKVTNAAFEAPGPSKYFSDAAIHAAKNWTFAPPSSNGEKVPSEWLLRFEFAPAGTETFSGELNP
ncbi:MAG: TonB family protein [Candidatus Acidiferrales bacterium]